MRIERQGRDEIAGRDLFVLGVESAGQVPSDLQLASPRFVCLVAWDADLASVDEISFLVEKLIAAGCVYFAAWGSDCGRVHDIFDEIVIGPNPPTTDKGPIMTTSHERESLEEAIEFVLGERVSRRGASKRV
jgi:hypothetical protein